MENSVLLGIDNSIDYLNIALSAGGRILEERSVKGASHPSQIIAVETRDMLTRHGYKPEDLDLIMTALGPGSFTGIRVGLAFCKGLSKGGNIPLIGVPTPDILAAPLSFMEGYNICPVIDAKKGEVFYATYLATGGRLERTSGYSAMKPEGIAAILKGPCLVLGTGVPLVAPHIRHLRSSFQLPGAFSRVSASVLIEEGLRRLESGAAEEPRPLYGRRSEAEIKFNVQLS
jgi:tRNA threonylcarbamoyladenosine biosynthesis protein TsaB